MSALFTQARAVLGQRELELLNYLHQQFPATVGHIPLAEKIHAVWQAGMLESINIIRERARLLSANGCKDTIREHYAEQEIRSAAWPNSISVEVSRSSSYLYSPFDACNPLLSRPFNG
jgi:hypothetical protein